jgi:hypothetical protein
MLINFDIGNIYSITDKETLKKIYYLAIRKQTLVTYKNGRFGKFTCNKKRHVHENSISVAKLCEAWNVRLSEFDDYMSNHFSPDGQALSRARKEKLEY